MELDKGTRPTLLQYVLPIALFLGITFLEGEFEKHYVWVYFAKIAIVVAALVWARPTWRDIRWQPGTIPLAVVLGFVLFLMWIAIEETLQYPHLGARTGFDPFAQISDAGLRTAFIGIRLFGLVLLVPFMEELFWRSFLIRYASQSQYQSLPIGTFTLTGAAITCGLFAIAHTEWIPAFLFAAALAGLLYWTKSVFACFVTHLVTNLSLGIYVLTQQKWIYW